MWPTDFAFDLEILAGVVALIGLALLAAAARGAQRRRDRIRTHEDELRRLGT